MIDVAAAVTAVKTLASVVKQAGRIDLTQQVIDLQQTLLDLVAQNTELTAEVAGLKEELRHKDAALQLQRQFAFDRDCYWKVNETSREGPFCSRCFDAEAKAVRMHDVEDGYFRCPKCSTTVLVDASRQPPRRRANLIDLDEY